MKSLRLIRSKSPQHLPTLELILQICESGGEEGAPQEILEALGQAYLQGGQFKKAVQLFQRLVDREPLNEHYNDLLGQALQEQAEELGNAHVADLPRSAAAFIREEAAAPPASPLRVGDREALVREALENSELFARYHLVRRAVAELERVLEIYPDETEIHKRLVGMCWRDMPERAEQAAQALARIYAQQGDAEGAKRFAQMAGGGEAAATTGLPLESVRPQAVSPEPSPLGPAQPAGIPAGEIDLASRPSLTPIQEGQGISSNLVLPPAPQALPPALSELPLDLATLAPSAIPTGPSSEIQEIDLSEDWEVFLAQRAKSSQGLQAPQKALSFNYDDSRIEVNFYLEHGFLEEANGAVGELERMLPGDPRIAELRALVEAHTGAVAIEGLEKEPAKALEGTPEELVAPPGGETVEGQAVSSNNAMPEPEAKPAAGLPLPPREERPPTDATPGRSVATSADLLGDFAEGFESALEKLEGPAPALAEETSTEAAPGVSVEASAKLLGGFSEAFESATGRLEGVSSPPAPSSGSTAPFIPSPQSREGDETVQESSPEDDPEAHYNLGVAFWEMNLPDEAIRELQQVVKGAGIRPQPPNYLEACTLLATCFMDKGMASVAVKWYGRALQAPHLDEEAWLALHYDLGVAYERSGDLPRALEEFSEVYSRNIAFRDVAEKVRTFQQKGSSR
jgi:tetratricopeptide (TPR) repeat protein